MFNKKNMYTDELGVIFLNTDMEEALQIKAGKEFQRLETL